MPRRFTLRAGALRALAAAWSAVSSVAWGHQPPPRYARARPTLELSPWVSLGGGARVTDAPTVGLFDLRLGGDVTAALGRKGDLRLGPFVEVGTATFASFQSVAGVELFVGAAPRPLRMFYYPGEGAFTARLGAGWVLRPHDLPDARSAPVASLTLTYGYRAPFSLREPEDQSESTPDQRATARYMTGVRLWIGAVIDLSGPSAWQLSGGIEFEPVGSFRYLLGLY